MMHDEIQQLDNVRRTATFFSYNVGLGSKTGNRRKQFY